MKRCETIDQARGGAAKARYRALRKPRQRSGCIALIARGGGVIHVSDWRPPQSVRDDFSTPGGHPAEADSLARRARSAH
jgi:hypothetical protein